MKEEDLYTLPYPFSKPKMDLNTRAKIFLPFNALKGFEEKINEINQVDTTKVQLDDNMEEEIQSILTYYSGILSSKPYIHITYLENECYRMDTGLLMDIQPGYILFKNKIIYIKDIYEIN